ncbi:MAG: hypothetical protein NT028_06645 [candidate division Zixibacteria bacterium]|nr:hypothetical protein [candidate division Zixibacteria bacterium]
MDRKNDRPFIGVVFKCCKVYSRIYLNKQRTAFVGWCPRCAAQIRIKVSPDGTDARFFEMT